MEWGKKGDDDGQFDLPHSITLDGNHHIYVADREKSRIQIFDSTGKFLGKSNDESYGNINAFSFDEKTSCLLATDDLTFLKIKHRGSDVYVFDRAGVVENRFGRSGNYDGPTGWFHDIAVDHDENLYLGDILNNRVLKFKKIGPK